MSLGFHTFASSCSETECIPAAHQLQYAEEHDEPSLLQMGSHNPIKGQRRHLAKASDVTASQKRQAIEGVSLFQVDSDTNVATTRMVVTDASELHRFVMFGSVLFVSILVVGLGLTARTFLLPISSKKAMPSTVRTRLRQLRVTRGSELENKCGSQSKNRKSKASNTPSKLMRLQGKVVAVTEQRMVGPFSGEAVVVCAASVSQPRLDGVTPPSVAYHSAFTDFVIELLDEPKIRLKVSGADVALFDLVKGNVCGRHSFATAPDSWRTFALSNLSSTLGTTSLVRGTIDGCGELTFQEASLLVGATVSCVGEVARDMKGELALVPWIPPDFDTKAASGSHGKVPAINTPPWWRKSWGAFRACQNQAFKDVFVGRVMISDDPVLLEGKHT